MHQHIQTREPVAPALPSRHNIVLGAYLEQQAYDRTERALARRRARLSRLARLAMNCLTLPLRLRVRIEPAARIRS